MKAIRTPKNRHAGIIRLILINKHELRYLKRLLEAFRIKRATLIARGVALMPDDPSELHERILQVRESLFHLVLMYDKATVTPNLHERAQLLGVSHIALKQHRAAIADMSGQHLEQTLLTDVVQHGEVAQEPGLESIWECTAREHPLFDACCLNLIRKVELPDDWLESFADEIARKANRERRSHLRVVT